MKKSIVCAPKSLPSGETTLRAAARAFRVNPANRPALEGLLNLVPGLAPTADHLAASRTSYWGSGGVRLTVSFLDNPPGDLRTRILSHMNAWSQTANVAFAETHGHGLVRIARIPNAGYWSYVGTDILQIPEDQPTMNLESFSMNTDDSEFHRVVRHETGHTLGFVHEHLRRDLVARIDPRKAIEYFMRTQGWSVEQIKAQVLTPIEETSLLGTDTADARSIMCYELPGEITTDGLPIIGGTDIDPDDFALAARLYPMPPLAIPTRGTEAPLGVTARQPSNGHNAIVFVANSDPAFVAAVIAATQG